VANLVFENCTVFWASWRFTAEEKVPNLAHTNEVTAAARIHLYGYPDRLQERALFCDTESVMYVQPDEIPRLVETADCQGAMTSELKQEHYMEEFISGDPKTYAYVTVGNVAGCRKTVCKIKGITLNFAVSQLVNFDLIKEMVLNDDGTDIFIVHIEKKIKTKNRAEDYI
jgi:hypothetical protein